MSPAHITERNAKICLDINKTKDEKKKTVLIEVPKPCMALLNKNSQAEDGSLASSTFHSFRQTAPLGHNMVLAVLPLPHHTSSCHQMKVLVLASLEAEEDGLSLTSPCSRLTGILKAEACANHVALAWSHHEDSDLSQGQRP